MKKLIMGIIFLVVCIGITIYNEINLNHKYKTNIYSITNSGAKTLDVNVYLDATYIAGTIKNDESKSYYVIFGDGVQYIVYMDNVLANKINSYLLNNPDKSYRIIGVTKEISKELEDAGKKFIKKWLDINHHDNMEDNHSHDITTDDFYHYFGYVYLDNVNNSNLCFKIIIYITGILGILLIFNFILKRYHLFL